MMIGRNNHSVYIVQRLVDALVSFLAWELAYAVRFLLMTGQPGLFYDFLYLSAGVVLLTLFLFTRNHLYETNRYYSWYHEFLLILKSHAQTTVLLVIGLYFFIPDRLSRIAVILYFLLVVVLSFIARGIVRVFLHRARKRGKNLSRLVIVGAGTELKEYVRRLLETPEKGIRVAAWVHSKGLASEFGVPEAELSDVVLEGSEAPNAVIVGYSDGEERLLGLTIQHFNKSFIPTFVVPNLESAFIGYRIEQFQGVPMMAVNKPRLTMFQAILKRLIDFFGAFLGLLVLSPFLLVIGIAVKITSRGPVFYGQERMSLDGKTFKMWKFRSMKVDAEEKSGAKWASKNDDRRTPIGAFLRRTSIDEFPQLWNVLIGNMSLVGPRPERPVFIEEFKEQIPAYMLRHRMKAGMTGWAQVNGWRGDTSLEKRIEFDLYYIRNWSMGLDFRILLLTVIKGFVNENAY